jgi:hypothetical protein
LTSCKPVSFSRGTLLDGVSKLVLLYKFIMMHGHMNVKLILLTDKNVVDLGRGAAGAECDLSMIMTSK